MGSFFGCPYRFNSMKIGLGTALDTIIGRTAWSVPNLKATEIKNIEDAFHWFFADKIMTKIVDYTNNRIHQTIAHLQRVESYTKPIHKYK